MITNVLSENEHEAIRREEKIQARLASPTALKSLKEAQDAKIRADAALEEALANRERAAHDAAEYDRLVKQRDDLAMILSRAEELLKSLPREIKGWQVTVREFLLAQGLPASTQRQHAAGQVAMLRVMLEELPACIKSVKEQLAANKALILGFEKPSNNLAVSP
jgi:hypothetical protein